MVWKEKRILALIILVLSVFLSVHSILWIRKPIHAVEYTLPLSFNGWSGSEVAYDRELLTSWLGTDRIVFRNYEDNRRGYTVSLYVAYYSDIGSSDKAHAPEVCYPGQGWIIRESGIIDLPIAGRLARVKRLVVEKGSQKEIVYSWWQTGRAHYARNSIYHLAQVISSIVSRDTSSIWVRISADEEQGHKGGGEEAIRFFCNEAAPLLEHYFSYDREI